MTDAPGSGAGSPRNPDELSGPLGRFFDWVRSTGIVRGNDRWLAGVCGGIARRAGLSPLVVRVIAIVLAVLGGPVLFAYAVGWALLPDPQGRIHAEQALRGVFEPVIVAIIVLIVLSFGSSPRGLWWPPQTVPGLPDWLTATLAVGWSIALTVGVIWLVVFLARRNSAPPGSSAQRGAGAGASAGATSAGAAGWSAEPGRWRRDRHPGAGFTAIALGLALAAGAVAAGVYSGGAWSNQALLVGLACGLGVLALGIIVSGIRGRDAGALGGIAFLAVVALAWVGIFPAGTQFFPFGAPTWAVGSASADAVPGYAVVAGRATIDLTALDDAAASGDRTIDVWMGFGVTELVLPTDRPVRVEANSIIGGIDYAGNPSTEDRGGVFFHDSRTFNGTTASAMPLIRVWTLIGQAVITGTNR